MPMNTIVPAARSVIRWLQDFLQIREDFRWHSRYGGAEFAPRWKRVIEQAKLLRSSAIDAEDYYRLGLYRTDLSLDHKAAFIGKYRKYRYYDRINPQRYEILGHDKALMHLLAQSLQVPMPTVLATTGPLDAPGLGARISRVDELRDFLARPDAENLFFKPVTGSLGEDTLSLGTRVPGAPTGWFALPSHRPLDMASVLAHLQGSGEQLRRFLIQSRAAPHSALADVVPDVLATVRVGTYFANGEVHLLGAALRMGNGSEAADNSMLPGGLSVAIDLVTGELGDGFTVRDGLPVRRMEHPVTGKRLTGMRLPYWPQVLEVALESARKFSFIPWLAWDVGVTDSGPLITEFNTHTRWTSIQMPAGRGLLEGKLGSVLLAHHGITRSGLRFPQRLTLGGGAASRAGVSPALVLPTTRS